MSRCYFFCTELAILSNLWGLLTRKFRNRASSVRYMTQFFSVATDSFLHVENSQVTLKNNRKGKKGEKEHKMKQKKREGKKEKG